MLFENAIEKILGIPYVEIFANTHCELRDSFMKETRKKLDDSGTKCVSLHPYNCPIDSVMLFSEYERRVPDFLEYQKYFFNAMNILGAKIFVFHGNKKTLSVSDELYFERFLKLYESGKTFGVTVAQENIANGQCGSLEFLKKMKRSLGDKANFVFDLKQCVRAGEDIYETAAALKDNIVHVHLSDSGKNGDCLPVGKGDLDLKRLVSMLNDVTYILELYRNNYNGAEDLLDNFRMIEREMNV
jgi:sugar phosphate isomerase/epimerase